MTKSRQLWRWALIILLMVLILAGGGVWYAKAGNKSVPVISQALDRLSDNKDEPAQPQQQIEFKNYGPAPEFPKNTKWLSGDAQSMASLKGKVVMVSFWTYASMNSSSTNPTLNNWQNKYRDNGLQIIGVHTPQYAFEKISDNVTNAIKTQGINFPVVQDNDYKIWSAYHNQFWPAIYLVDPNGNIVYTHYGESDYDTIEKATRKVLGLDGNYTPPPAAAQDQSHTPQIYLGLAKLTQFGNSEKAATTEQIFSYPKKLGDSKFALEGQWVFNQEAAIHTNGFARLKLNFDAAKVFMVAQSAEPTTIRVYVDGVLVKGVVVSDSQLYQLYDSLAGGKHTLELEIPDKGFQVTTFTFS